MSEQITVIVEKPITVTHVVRGNVGTVTVKRAAVTDVNRQLIVQPSRRTVSTTILDPRTTTVGLPGIQGPQGERGPAGAGGSTFVYDQTTAATVWNIHHNLGLYPSVDVIDSAGAQWYGAVTYVDSNNITITFAAAFAGQAFLN